MNAKVAFSNYLSFLHGFKIIHIIINKETENKICIKIFNPLNIIIDNEN